LILMIIKTVGDNLMPRVCTICNHEDREEIDRRLVNGESYTKIAKEFSVSYPALYRHNDVHIPEALVKAEDAKAIANGDNLLDSIKSLAERATVILDRAEQSGDMKTALGGIREARGCIELLAKIEGQINNRPQVNVQLNLLQSPEWIELRGQILRAIEPYPEAKKALISSLP
jgi:hypothetical protein